MRLEVDLGTVLILVKQMKIMKILDEELKQENENMKQVK